MIELIEMNRFCARKLTLVSDILVYYRTGDDTLAAMADAVEKSDIVIIFLSERYKDSQSCRSGNYKLYFLLSFV